MRVLGYGFREPDAALRAQRVLVHRFDLHPEDARVAELANDGVVLGVRAREENLDEVARVLANHGGRELVDVDERRTGLRATG